MKPSIALLLALTSATACSTSQGEGARAGTAAQGPTILEGLGLKTPESVLYDGAADVYFVSNINGDPTMKDDNGFITQLSPDGTVIALAWIDGASEAIELHAPKGMAIADGVLYVADITAVRMFDRASGASKGKVELPGATFLNDVTPAPGGGVLVSDSGLMAGADGFAASGADAVYQVMPDGTFTQLAKGDELGRPNGLLVIGDGVAVVTFGSGELYTLDPQGKRTNVTKLPSGSLDGIVVDNRGRTLISSWEGKGIFARDGGGEFVRVSGELEAPADIAYDSKRNRVVVPLFTSDKLVFQPL